MFSTRLTLLVTRANTNLPLCLPCTATKLAPALASNCANSTVASSVGCNLIFTVMGIVTSAWEVAARMISAHNNQSLYKLHVRIKKVRHVDLIPQGLSSMIHSDSPELFFVDICEQMSMIDFVKHKD